jgi:uncharacterized protein (TIGR03382 family)
VRGQTVALGLGSPTVKRRWNVPLTRVDVLGSLFPVSSVSIHNTARVALALATLACSAPDSEDAPQQRATIQQTILGAEFALSTPTHYDLACGTRDSPQLSFDGQNYLVVWSDARAGSYDITATRLTPDAQVLDLAGRSIAPSTNGQYAARTAFGAGVHLVVWQEAGGPEWRIKAIRVDTNGQPIGSSFDPSSGAESANYPDVASDGTNFVIVWSDTNHQIYGARVAPDGTVLDPKGIALGNDSGTHSWPRLAFDGQNYLVTWTDFLNDDPQILGIRFSPDGAILDPTPIAIMAEQGGYSDVDFDGTSFVVAAGGPVARVRRVSTDGQALGAGPIPLSSPAASGWFINVACMPPSCLVAWTRQVSTYHYREFVTRVEDGEVVDGAGTLVASAGYAPAVAHHDSGWMLVFGSVQDSIKASRVSLGGQLLDDPYALVSGSAPYQSDPVAAWGNGQFLVAWAERADNDVLYDMLATRVTEDGAVLDDPPIHLASSTSGRLSDVSFDGTQFWVAWSRKESDHHFDGWAARVTSQGEILDPGGRRVASGPSNQSDCHLAFGGDGGLLVWMDDREDSWDIYASRVSPTGEVLDVDGIPIATTLQSDRYPRVVYGDGVYFVVWEVLQRDVLAARVTPDGDLLDPGGIPLCADDTCGGGPDVAFGDGVFAVSWLQSTSATYSYKDVVAARVGSDGVMLDPNGVVAGRGPSGKWAPAIDFDGTSFFVAWQDTRNGPRDDIYGSWLSVTGMVSDNSGTLLSAEPHDEEFVGLASSEGERTLLTYARYSYDIAHGSQRVFGRILEGLDTGASCSDDAGCVSGHCVDGVCCNEACKGGEQPDCLACSIVAGAVADGTCTPIADGTDCLGGQCQAGVCHQASDAGPGEAGPTDASAEASWEAASDAALDGAKDAAADSSTAADSGSGPDGTTDAQSDVQHDAATDATDATEDAIDASDDLGGEVEDAPSEATSIETSPLVPIAAGGGCGCATTRDTGSAWAIALLTAFVAFVRRRARSDQAGNGPCPLGT